MHSAVTFLLFNFVIPTLGGTIHYEQEKHLANVTQLTFTGVNAEAYFSFDGKEILFQATDSEKGTGECDQIFRLRLDDPASAPVMVSNGKGRTTCSFFLNDNRRFIYSTTFHHNETCPLHVCKRDDAPKECNDRHPYLWDVFNDYDIVLDDGNGTLTFLTNDSSYDAEGVVSPDGKSIVFTSSRSGDLELWLMDIDGANKRQVTNISGYDGGAFFSPDSTKLVFRANHVKNAEELEKYQELLRHMAVSPSLMDIYTINVDGTDMKQITYLKWASWAPYYHPDGKRIIFSSNHHHFHPSTFNLFMINDDGTGLSQITYDKTFDSFPMFSPDGKKLIFISARNSTGPHKMNIFLADWVESGVPMVRINFGLLIYIVLTTMFYPLF